MAAKVRRELKADVDMVPGHYGEFKVLVDGDTVVEAGAGAFLGILPSSKKVLSTVQERLTVAVGASAGGGAARKAR